MGRHFDINWDDLNSEKQEDMIREVMADILDEFKNEAEATKKKYPKAYEGRTWQWVYTDMYDLDDLLGYPEKEQQRMAEFSVNEHAEEMAEEKCAYAFAYDKIIAEVE